MNKKLHILGSHGVPARYGGFETLADQLCQYLGKEYDITVYCSKKDYPEKRKEYFGAKLKYFNIGASGFSGIIYDLITFPIALFKADVILLLGPAGAGFIVLLAKLTRTKVIVNHGGLNEWEREKLSWLQKRWAKFNHRVASRNSNLNIADNFLYQESLKKNFGADSVVIKYGGEHVKPVSTDQFSSKYGFLNEKYAVSLSRAQVDNNLHLLLEGFEHFTGYPLVLVSNWSVTSYGRDLLAKYKDSSHCILLDAIHDMDEINCIRSNAHVYIHTHGRSGTAPSLVEAMSLGLPVISFNTAVNMETTDGKAKYFSNTNELLEQLNKLDEGEIDTLAQDMSSIAAKNYRWTLIAEKYIEQINKLLN